MSFFNVPVCDSYNIFCLSWFNILYVLKVTESGLFLRQPELVRKKKTSLAWKDREDGTLLRDIAVSNNILYGAMVTSDLRWSIITLDKSNFFCLSKLNTIGTIPQPKAGDSWQMAGNRRLLVVRYRDDLAFLTTKTCFCKRFWTSKDILPFYGNCNHFERDWTF